MLYLKAGGTTKVHWSGPSIGFDAGANVSKVFVFYVIGGVSANYHQADDIILAPIRLGAGLRAGVNIGYMKYTRRKTWNPF
jgi:hypothetical protein